MVSNHLDMMYIVTAMHAKCERDNEEHDSVVMCFCMGGWLAYLPTQNGLRKPEGLRWIRHQLGSNRLQRFRALADRYHWLDGKREPAAP